jgi:hypothetical protein
MTKICARCILDKVKIVDLSWLKIKKISCGHGYQKGHPLHKFHNPSIRIYDDNRHHIPKNVWNCG